jgi:hypothetical protein
MTETVSSDERTPPLLCRLLGHRWKPCHKVERIQPFGLLAWVYVDDVCQRCYRTEYRMPSGDSYQETYPCQTR